MDSTFPCDSVRTYMVPTYDPARRTVSTNTNTKPASQCRQVNTCVMVIRPIWLNHSAYSESTRHRFGWLVGTWQWTGSGLEQVKNKNVQSRKGRDSSFRDAPIWTNKQADKVFCTVVEWVVESINNWVIWIEQNGWMELRSFSPRSRRNYYARYFCRVQTNRWLLWCIFSESVGVLLQQFSSPRSPLTRIL